VKKNYFPDDNGNVCMNLALTKRSVRVTFLTAMFFMFEIRYYGNAVLLTICLYNETKTGLAMNLKPVSTNGPLPMA